MKRIYVNEKWCLGCHLCEYYCAFANSGKSDMVKALKNIRIHPRIHIEEGANGVHFAVNCRHCADPLCVKGCITGALTRQNGMIVIDENKCVGCFTCILSSREALRRLIASRVLSVLSVPSSAKNSGFSTSDQ